MPFQRRFKGEIDVADFSYVHQIKDIEANKYRVTDYRLYADNNDASTYKNI